MGAMQVAGEIARIIKLVLVGAIIGGVPYVYLWYSDNQDWSKDYNEAVNRYNNEHWTEAVAAYDRAWARHPSNTGFGARDYAAAAVQAGDKAYSIALAPGVAETDAEKGQTFEDALALYEAARARKATLPDKSRENLCDAYIQVGQFAQARKLIDEVKQGSGLAGTRYAVLEGKITRFEK